MKPGEPEEKPGSAHFVRSERGLWVKAEMVLNEIKVYHQSRHLVEGGQFYKIGPDEEILHKTVCARAEYDDPWLLDGTVVTNRAAIFDLCDLADYWHLVYGICRQVAELVALGWGANPSEVVGWFQEPETGCFVVQGSYMVVGPARASMEGLVGMRMDMAETEHTEDGVPVLRGRVYITDEQYHEFSLEGLRELGAFLIGAMPVAI